MAFVPKVEDVVGHTANLFHIVFSEFFTGLGIGFRMHDIIVIYPILESYRYLLDESVFKFGCMVTLHHCFFHPLSNNMDVTSFSSL